MRESRERRRVNPELPVVPPTHGIETGYRNRQAALRAGLPEYNPDPRGHTRGPVSHRADVRVDLGYAREFIGIPAGQHNHGSTTLPGEHLDEAML